MYASGGVALPTALRRAMALVLALGLLLGAGAAAFAASGSVPFTDLGDVPWAVPGITALQEQGVLLGTAPGIFDPSAPVSRAQMATVLGRLLGWPASGTTASATFQDAATIPAYALPYVVTAAQDGILVGLPGDLFAPLVNVTWDQLAVIVARAYTYPQVLANQIPSLIAQLPTGTQTPSWAIEAVAQDVQAGDFSGVLGDLYRPGQPVTRAELAAFLLQVEQSKGTGSAPVNGSVAAGQVTAVSAASLTIGDQSVPIASSASVYVGSAASNLSAVQVGDTVSVVLSAGQAILINVTATPGSSSVTALTGTITSIATTQLGLSVPGQTTVELPLDPSVSVTVNGTTSSLLALQVGQQATVSLDASGNVAAIAVTGAGASATTVTGVVGSVTATEVAITPSGGSQQSYPLATDVTVNGLAGNLGAVTAGETVILTLSGGQVTAIATTGGALAVSTTSLPAATVGSAYSTALAATGGSGADTWTGVGSLPQGLSLTSAGVLSGTPSTAGTYAIAVQVTDGSGATATASLSLTVAATAGSLAVTTTALPSATLSQAYSTTLAATGGSGGYTWMATGSLPQGLSLTSTGVLSGTPAATGVYAIPVQVTDSSGATATASLSLTVGATAGSLAVTTTALPSASLSQFYSTTLAATGGSGGYTWMATGSLPQGLSLTSAGLLSGTPTASGTYAIPVQVTDGSGATATASLSLTVAGAAGSLSILTTNLPTATVGVSYSVTLQSTGGTGAETWSYSGSLPPGLSVSAAGQLSGTPTTTGSYTFSLVAADSAGDTASQAVTLTVVSGGGGIVVTTTSLPQASINQAFSTNLSATGGTGNYSWTYTGSLPAGVSLTLNGQISGTPTVAGEFTFTVTVTDTNGNHANAQLTLSVQGPTQTSTSPLGITTSTLPSATVGVQYATTLTATGGSGGYIWTYSGALAPGLGLSQSGVLSGTPTGAGTFYIDAMVRDSGNNSATQQLTITVNAAGGSVSGAAVAVTTTSLPGATLDQPYSTTLSASGGAGGYTWVYTGSLPQGLSLSTSGTLSGTPTTSGTYTISVQAVSSAAGSVSAARQLTLTVAP